MSSNENSRLNDVRNHRKQKKRLSEPVVSVQVKVSSSSQLAHEIIDGPKW